MRIDSPTCAIAILPEVLEGYIVTYRGTIAPAISAATTDIHSNIIQDPWPEHCLVQQDARWPRDRASQWMML